MAFELHEVGACPALGKTEVIMTCPKLESRASNLSWPFHSPHKPAAALSASERASEHEDAYPAVLGGEGLSGPPSERTPLRQEPQGTKLMYHEAGHGFVRIQAGFEIMGETSQ